MSAALTAPSSIGQPGIFQCWAGHLALIVPGGRVCGCGCGGVGVVVVVAGMHDFSHILFTRSTPCKILFCIPLIAFVVRSSSTTNRPAISPLKFLPSRGLVKLSLS